MAGYGDVPFGLRQVVITDENGANAVALPRGLLLTVTPRMEAAEFGVNGVLVGAVTMVTGADWEVEAGGISLEAWARLTGLTLTAAGSTPNRTWSMAAGAGAVFPYCRVYGRAVGAVGTDDVYCRLYRCKVTSLEGTFRRGEFWITSCAGVAVKHASGVLEFVQRETGAALV